MQPVRKRLAARRATAGLAKANSKEHNNADNRFLTGPKGAPQMGQCCVAVLVKGTCHSLRTAPCLGPFGMLCILRYLIEGVLTLLALWLEPVVCRNQGIIEDAVTVRTLDHGQATVIL